MPFQVTVRTQESYQNSLAQSEQRGSTGAASEALHVDTTLSAWLPLSLQGFLGMFPI